MKICTIIGARPQFVKAAAVSHAFAQHPEIKEIMVHTGQHYDYGMSDIFFDELGIPAPSYNLGVGSGLHGAQTGQMLAALEQVMMDEKPDWTLIYGDTNSTLAGALASVKLHIPIAHVEAGLRSFNRSMPEEINRIIADSISTLLFAPTRYAVEQLEREGHCASTVHHVGDVMYDIMLKVVKQARTTSKVLSAHAIERHNYLLVTVHRAENTDDEKRLAAIINSFIEVATTLPVVFPVHPRTRAALERANLWRRVEENLIVLPPVGYLDMVALLDGAKVVTTDSGGVQKEAFFLHKPCFTLRSETEWVELVAGGWNQLILPDDFHEMAGRLLNHSGFMKKDIAPYGKGDAAGTIAKILMESERRGV